MRLDVLYNISKISLRSNPRRPGFSLHRLLLLVLDPTSALPSKSIQPTHSLVNLSVFQSIPCLFGCIYHTRMCSLMLVTCFHKGFPKIHPDASKNACGVWTTVGHVCCVLTRWSPTQVIIQINDQVFIMFHITYDIIVQTVSQLMHSIIRNMWSTPELSVGSTDWISLIIVLTQTGHRSLTRVIYYTYFVSNPTRGLTWSHPRISAASTQPSSALAMPAPLQTLAPPPPLPHESETDCNQPCRVHHAAPPPMAYKYSRRPLCFYPKITISHVPKRVTSFKVMLPSPTLVVRLLWSPSTVSYAHSTDFLV
jgi:hypothetical protein